MSHLHLISIYGYVGNKLFLDQSIGIDEVFWVNRQVLMKYNTFQLHFYSSIKTVGAAILGGLWAWHAGVGVRVGVAVYINTCAAQEAQESAC